MATQTRFIFGIWDDTTNDFVRYPDGTPVVRKSPRGWVPGDALPTLLELLKYFPLFEGLLSSVNTSGCNTTLPVTPITDPPVVVDSPLVFAFGQHYESAADEVAPYLVERYILVASSITEGAAPVQAVLMELYSNGSRRPYPGVVLWSMPSRPTNVITIDPSTGFITVPSDSISQNSLIGIQATIGADSPVTSSIQLINVNPTNPAPKVGNPAPDVLITIPGVQTFTLPADQFYDPGDTQTLSAFMLNGDGTLSPLPDGITFDYKTRTFTVPAAVLVKQFPIRVVNTDSAGQSTPDDFLLTINRQVQNRPPVLVNQLANVTLIGGTQQTFNFPANTFSDPDNDPLTYVSALNNGQALPNGLTFDGPSRTFTMPAAYPYPTQISLRTRASDPTGAYADMYFLLIVKAAAATNVIQNLLVELTVGWRSPMPSTGTFSENVNVYAKVSNNFTGRVQMRYVQSRYPGSADWGDMFPLPDDHPLRAQGYTHRTFYNDEQYSGRTNPFNQFVARLVGVSNSDVVGIFNVAASAQDGEKYLIYPVNS